MSDYSIDELISVCIARQVVDGEVLAQGINTPLVLAGFILAKCTHAPGVSFACAIGQSLCQEWAPLSVSRVEELWLDRSLLNVGFATAAADLLPGYHPKEFFRPAQIDAAATATTSPSVRITTGRACACQAAAASRTSARATGSSTSMCRATHA